jgi:hypothetical protein
MKTVYEQREWAVFLLKNKKIKLVREELKLGKAKYDVNYYLKKIGPFTFIGAPLFATTTGPMNSTSIDTELKFIDCIEILKVLGSRNGVLSAEMLKSDLEFPNAFESVDKHFQITKYTHYEIDLNLSLEAIVANFSNNVKRKLKKSEQNNLTVRVEVPNNDFAEKFHLMLTDVFRRQGKKPTYPLQRVRDLLYTKELKDNLLCLGVYSSDDEKIASSIFVYNEYKSYFWGGASYEDKMYLCPNEKMHYEAMRILKSRGVSAYEFGGGGSYKERYGPVKKEGTHIIYTKYYWVLNLRRFLFGVYKRYVQKLAH